MQPHEKMIEVRGAPLHIRIWGDENAAHHMLYWHGRGSTGLSINEAAPLFVERYNARVISLDAPGFGQSPVREASAYEMPQLAHLASVLAQTLDLTSLIFVGHSWGGIVGCHVAALYPQLVKHLVLLDTGYLNPDDRSYTTQESIEETVNFYQVFQFDDWDAYLDEEKKHLPRWSEALAESFRKTMQQKNEKIVPVIIPHVIAALEHAYEKHPPISTYQSLKEAHTPILLLAATLPSRFHPTREKLIARFQAAVPQLKVQYLLETGHDVPSSLGPELANLIIQGLTQRQR